MKSNRRPSGASRVTAGSGRRCRNGRSGSGWRGRRGGIRCPTPAGAEYQLDQLDNRIVKLVDDTFFERNDGIIRDRNLFWANLGTAFRDVAIADVELAFEGGDAIGSVEGVHLQSGSVDQKSRPDEFLMFVMFAQDMADILAEKTLDAFAELLDAVHIFLAHAPRAIGGIRRPRAEGSNPLFHLVVPGNIRDEVLHMGEGLHRFDDDRFAGGKVAEPGHAHEPRHAVDLGGAGPAFARFAIPAAGQVRRLRRLNLVDGIQNDHPFPDFHGIIPELALPPFSAPDAKQRLRHQTIPP